MEDDIALLRRYAEVGDESAFAALVERRIDFVYSAALRHLNGAVHRAQDVSQTVFIQMAGNAKTLAKRHEILGWLYVATHHAAANLKRTDARRQAREAEAHSMHFSSSETDPLWEQLLPLLDESMLALPENDRQAILSRYFQNESFATLGSKLGVTADAARMRLDRALERLRDQFSRRGISSTSAALSGILTDRATVAAPAGFAAVVTGAALSGVGSVGTLATSGGILSAKVIATVASSFALLGILLYSLSADGGTDEHPSFQHENGVARQAPSANLSTRERPASGHTAPRSESSVEADGTTRVMPSQNAVVGAQTDGGLPQIVLSEVLGPNNLYHDALFGLSMTFPDGWSVREARRWGDRNRHNTVVFNSNGALNINTNMYYKLFQPEEAALRDQSVDSFLSKVAADKEASRVGATFTGYRNVPESFEVTQVDGNPCMSYFATFLRGDQVMTEYFVRLLGPRGYVTFFTIGPLDEIRPVMPHVKAMAKSVRLP